MQVQFDTIQGAQAEVAGQLSTIVRTGLITGVEGNANADPSILLRATQAVFDQASQGYTGLAATQALQRLMLLPVANTNDLRFSAAFILPTQNFVTDRQQVMTWLIEVSTSMQMETEQLDLNGNPIQTFYYADGGTVQAGANGGVTINTSASNQPAQNTAEMSVLRPRKTLTISGFSSVGGYAYDGAIDCVNSKKWSGLDPGYWLCTDVQSRAQNAYPRNGSTADFIYHNRASFVSKVRRDWSHYAIHRNINGKIPFDLAKPETAAKIQQLVYKTAYSTTQNRTINGVLKVGLYQVADFKSIFGFNLDDYLA